MVVVVPAFTERLGMATTTGGAAYAADAVRSRSAPRETILDASFMEPSLVRGSFARRVVPRTEFKAVDRNRGDHAMKNVPSRMGTSAGDSLACGGAESGARGPGGVSTWFPAGAVAVPAGHRSRS